MNRLEAEEKFLDGFELMVEACRDQGWGDPFSYNRAKEIYTSIALKHEVSTKYAGADAFLDGEEVEYKSTIQDRIQGTYTGISVFPTWKEQEHYLRYDKIGKYKLHFFARFDRVTMELVECWKMTGDKALEVLLPKLKKQFEKKNRGKDPRLGANISMTDLKTHGEQIF